MEKRAGTLDSFKKMFEKANKAEAGKFAQTALAVGQNLDKALKEALSSNLLHDEQREECPAKYRTFVNAYFEGLSKAVNQK
jgi:hypothetical protein